MTTNASKHIFYVVLLVLSQSWILARATNVVTDLDRLEEHLLANYRGTLPSNGAPVEISLLMHLLQIMELDGQSQVLHTSVQLAMSWTDIHLTWHPNDYGDTTNVVLPASSVWLPRIGLINSVGVVRDDSWEQIFPVLVSSSGHVTWQVTAVLSSACSLNMRSFPFDIQECVIQIGNLVHGVKMVHLLTTEDEINLEFFPGSKQYDILDRRAVKTNRTTSTMPGYVLENIDFRLKLQRKPLYFILNLLVPCLVLSILACVPFSIPVNAGEKLSISITILLSFSVFLIVLADITPRTSEHVPSLSIYLAVIMVVTGVSLFCTVITLNLHHSDPSRPMPPLLHDILINKLGRALRIVDPNKKQLNSFTSNRHSSNLSKVHPQKIQQSQEEAQLTGEITRDIQQVAAVDAIAEDVRQMALSEKEKVEEEEREKQWQLAARILDRLFLYICIVIVSITTIGLVIVYPIIQM